MAPGGQSPNQLSKLVLGSGHHPVLLPGATTPSRVKAQLPVQHLWAWPLAHRKCLQNGGRAVTVTNKRHWRPSKSLNPSQPQFPCLQNENSERISWAELVGRVHALTCKMLTNRRAQWPHLGPAGGKEMVEVGLAEPGALPLSCPATQALPCGHPHLGDEHL